MKLFWYFTEININNSENSLKLFSRFAIDTSFLQYDTSTWNTHVSFVNGKKLINFLKLVNNMTERVVKLMGNYNEALSIDEKQE